VLGIGEKTEDIAQWEERALARAREKEIMSEIGGRAREMMALCRGSWDVIFK
jgi:hypothetical protein